MVELFPRTKVENISLPRLLIGSNWLLGYSHTGSAADRLIHRIHDESDESIRIFEAFLSNGIDAVMGPISTGPALLHEWIERAEQKLGRHIIQIDTPVINVDDTPEARAETERIFRYSKSLGCELCLIHHSSAEQLVNKNKQQIVRLPDYLAMIRDCGMVPGLSAHMPELIQYSDLNEYDVQTYIQIFNCMGFMMQVEIESVIRIIHAAKKPVMTIKPMAAGRTTPYVGLTFNWNVLRQQDMITVGCVTADEAYEDIEISRAALEHRLPDLDGRSSPAKTSIIR